VSAADAPPERFSGSLDLIHERARHEAGSDDFGSGDYLPGLKMLLESMDYDPQFTAYGRRYAWDTVTTGLAARARAIGAMKTDPAFADVAIVAPVVITGIPRSGTTALHRLLAVDSRFQGLQAWLTDSPMPRPAASTWGDYPAYHKMVARLETRLRDAPGKKAAHDMAADAVDECCLILRQGFVSNIWTMGWSAASYDAWWQCRSEAESYRHFARCLQLIGSTDPGKRWLLKNPGHIDNLDLLFAIFPDARVIVTHRDPGKAIPSLASLLMQAHDRIEVGRRDARGRILLVREAVKWARAADKAEAVAARYPGRVMHVVHGDFHRDPMAVVERIYGFIGEELGEGARQAMAQRARERPELQNGVHRYDIADYGSSEAEVREIFGDYVVRHGLIEPIR
jgi:hypothetical protein